MLPREALAFLLEEDYAVLRQDGWFYVRRSPSGKDIARFVKAIKTLGAWSVETATGKAKVRITTGGEDAIDGLMFKIED